MKRQWASAWFNPEQNAWCVGFYTEGRAGGHDAWHTSPSESAAKGEADAFNAREAEHERVRRENEGKR